ncbi:Phytochrome-like protein cph1 [Gemmata obscuriglobus]|nr:ATP-binding protein [Gemmata obscuriglobus]QEG28726.1 Phytochrome-like protein cph1 [Gemmata obscuriglobus]VTS07015.1 sensor histidine kinase : GAF sensor signal transduction histidine kinase OS=Methylobacterium populi (strain ATCC BAA-705 / NCIMB 13946 / BJ001) GN=Mpop_0539 PE=4 SV=1: PAS_2: GAF: PHY: HisKA: HATPase_c [Gemmata obscuriglobus UQM 2246]
MNTHPEPDLNSCDREPIHTPGSIQPHGALLVLSGTSLNILQVSANAPRFFGRPIPELLGSDLRSVLGPEQFEPLGDLGARLPANGEPVLLRAVRIGNGPALNAIGHRVGRVVVLELEPGADAPGPPGGLHPVIAGFIAKVQTAPNAADLAQLAAVEVRAVTGFDRALVYRFEPDGTGVVVGEDGNGRLPSYRDHRFPASDIPKQARDLYRRNRLRLIPDVDYAPAELIPALNPVSGGPVDLSHAALRSVSPVHVEYMRNMGTAASMSVSVLRDGALWGLISCHHHAPKVVPFEARTTCDLLAQVLALQVAAREHAADYERRVEIQSVLTRLLAHMARADDYVSGLLAHPADLLGFVRAAGAAVVSDGRTGLVGRTPGEEQVRKLAAWLFREQKREVYHTDALSAAFPPAREYAADASGLLAVSVSKLHPTAVLWFRPEVIETVQWGGDPRKAVEPTTGRLHPRKSFETWSQTVRDKAVPWLPSEVAGAGELRNAVLGIVLRKAEEMAALNVELQRSNRELEAFSYSVSHDLRAPLRHIVGYAELLKEVARDKLAAGELKYCDTIIESSEYAGKLVDNLLAYSRMGRATLDRTTVDLNVLVREVRAEVMATAPGRQVRWEVGPLPTVEGDLMMLRLAVQNLLSNAVKYTKPRREAVIEIGCQTDAGAHTLHVRDNGVGFDMRYRDKLFGVFQRLHRWEDFEGTGIGLANVRRIVERHGGRAWAEGEVDRGATFYLTLPAPNNDEER